MQIELIFEDVGQEIYGLVDKDRLMSSGVTT
jgi:hypothetical protein